MTGDDDLLSTPRVPSVSGEAGAGFYLMSPFRLETAVLIFILEDYLLVEMRAPIPRSF